MTYYETTIVELTGCPPGRAAEVIEHMRTLYPGVLDALPMGRFRELAKAAWRTVQERNASGVTLECETFTPAYHARRIAYLNSLGIGPDSLPVQVTAAAVPPVKSPEPRPEPEPEPEPEPLYVIAKSDSIERLYWGVQDVTRLPGSTVDVTFGWVLLADAAHYQHDDMAGTDIPDDGFWMDLRRAQELDE